MINELNYGENNLKKTKIIDNPKNKEEVNNKNKLEITNTIFFKYQCLDNNGINYKKLRTDYTKLIETMAKKTEKYEIQIDKLKKENNQLNSNLNQSLDSYIKEIEKKNEKIKELKENIDKNKSEINNKNNEIKELNQKKLEIDNKNNEIKELKENIEKNKIVINNQNKEIKQLKENIEKNKIEISNKDNQIKQLKENLDKNKIEINNKNNEINQLKENLEMKERELINSKKVNIEYKDKMKEIDDDFKEKYKEMESNQVLLKMKIKKNEYENLELKQLLETEKKKVIVNNCIIKSKEKEIQNINKIFKAFEDILLSREKIIKNEFIDNTIIEKILNEREKTDNNNEEKYDKYDNYGKIGLANEELNCYMSSVIQILKNIYIFALNILEADKEDIITESLKKLFNNLYYSKEKYVSIYEFKKDFGSVYNKFKGPQQNDSTHFLLYLLQHLHKVFKREKKNISDIYQFKDLELNDSEEKELEKFLNKYESKNNSFIHDLFFGYQMNKISCSGCNSNKVSFQSFDILDIPLMDEKLKLESLEQCLNCYLLTRDKKNIPGFECSKCKKNLLSHLTSIIKLPSILIINLKRVGENTVYYHEIEIPFFFKAKHIDKLSKINKQYELIGFIKHIGNEKDGHNIAYSKNMIDNKWYSFNDRIVKEEKELPSRNKSFLLFYQLV